MIDQKDYDNLRVMANNLTKIAREMIHAADALNVMAAQIENAERKENAPEQTGSQS